MDEKIEKTITYAKSIAEQYKILFIANVAGETNKIDYENTQDSIITEYFTKVEYNNLFNAIKHNGFSIRTFFNEEEFIRFILDNDIKSSDKNIVFNLARNGRGLNKKSLIPSFCQFRELVFTGSSAYATCLGRHKFHYSQILENLGIPIAKTWIFSSKGWLLNRKPPIGLKVIVKPMFESASRGVRTNGIFIFKNTDTQLKYITDLCNEFSQDVIIQQFIDGEEIEVPVVVADSPIALGAAKITLDESVSSIHGIIDYEIAFNESYDFAILDNNESTQQIMKTSEKIVSCLGFSSYSRVDFRRDLAGNLYVIDISTHPYIIGHSSFAFIFQNLGYTYNELFAFIIGRSLVDDTFYSGMK
ncbi:ATP-grasp domain-containing protein [Enterococcus sp. AZ192]|uniref:ATP-grasp domain-containing protein n=1 Tax=unclassified Enterococcus TaxID=2608891 RepID=UPI003D297A38